MMELMMTEEDREELEKTWAKGKKGMNDFISGRRVECDCKKHKRTIYVFKYKYDSNVRICCSCEGYFLPPPLPPIEIIMNDIHK